MRGEEEDEQAVEQSRSAAAVCSALRGPWRSFLERKAAIRWAAAVTIGASEVVAHGAAPCRELIGVIVVAVETLSSLLGGFVVELFGGGCGSGNLLGAC